LRRIILQIWYDKICQIIQRLSRKYDRDFQILGVGANGHDYNLITFMTCHHYFLWEINKYQYLHTMWNP
jgi:hypothetical protein